MALTWFLVSRVGRVFNKVIAITVTLFYVGTLSCNVTLICSSVHKHNSHNSYSLGLQGRQFLVSKSAFYSIDFKHMEYVYNGQFCCMVWSFTDGSFWWQNLPFISFRRYSLLFSFLIMKERFVTWSLIPSNCKGALCFTTNNAIFRFNHFFQIIYIVFRKFKIFIVFHIK